MGLSPNLYPNCLQRLSADKSIFLLIAGKKLEVMRIPAMLYIEDLT